MSRHNTRPRLVGGLLGSLILGATVASAAAAGAVHARAGLVDGAGQVVGWARLTEDAAGRLHLNVHVEGLAPGRHGIHLHAIGSCVGPTFASAGGHHNPLGLEHGLDNDAGAHAGDLQNLVVNGAGRGHLDVVSDRATLSDGPVTLFDADGSAIVIHALVDDQVTNPTGNSGGRVACGVIEGA